jgi:chorismate mutase
MLHINPEIKYPMLSKEFYYRNLTPPSLDDIAKALSLLSTRNKYVKEMSEAKSTTTAEAYQNAIQHVNRQIAAVLLIQLFD